MNTPKLRSIAGAILSAGIAFVFLLLAAVPLRAQGVRNGPTSQSISKSSEQDLMSREWGLTHISDDVNKQFRKEQVSLFRQMNEDFRRIQIVNNQTMQSVFVNNSVDYKSIAVATDEIRKRALRLRQNLALPRDIGETKSLANQIQVKEQPLFDLEKLKGSLRALDHSVMGFVGNPLFKVRNVLDAKLAETAGRDLERIIQFSDSIRRDVERLGRIKPSH